MKHKKKTVRAITMLQIGIAGILIVLLVLLVLWYGKGLNSYETEEMSYQYIAGVKIEHGEGVTYQHRKGQTVLQGENQDENKGKGDDEMGGNTISNVPILYDNRKKITLPINMLIMMPSQSKKVWRVNYFTDVVDDGGRIFLENGKNKSEALGGFLYDGEDIYVFLEKATLHIGSQTVDLGPLSYIKVAYRNYVEYYNASNGSHEWLSIMNVDVTVDLANGVVINPEMDTIFVDDKESLLFSAVDSLDVYKMDKINE